MKPVYTFMTVLLVCSFTTLQAILFVFEDSGIPVLEWGFSREAGLLPLLRLVLNILFFGLFAILLVLSEASNYRQANRKQQQLDLIAI